MINKDCSQEAIIPVTGSVVVGLFQAPHAATLPAPHNQKYEELEQFRQLIEHQKSGRHYQHYTVNKKIVMKYRLIFAGLGTLFTTLGFIVYHKTLIMANNLLLGTWQVPKVSICTFCAIMALVAFAMAFLMRPEKEMINKLWTHAKRKLGRLYSQKGLELGHKGVIAFGDERRKVLALKHAYNEARDKISEKREEILHLVEKIANSRDMDSRTKENLFNQAALDFNDKINEIIRPFRHLPVSTH